MHTLVGKLVLVLVSRLGLLSKKGWTVWLIVAALAAVLLDPATRVQIIPAVVDIVEALVGDVRLPDEP